MKQRVVILSYHAFGHINACLKLARSLQNANLEVHFAGAGYFYQYALTQEFPYYILKSNPFGLGFETWINTQEKQKNVYTAALRDRITDRLAKDREADLYWMLKELKPKIVLIDSFQATDFILMYAWLKTQNIKVAILHTTLPLSLVEGRPPLNCEVFPQDKHAIKRAIQFLKWKRFKKKFVKKIVCLGFDDSFIIRRRTRKNSIPSQYISKTPGLLNFSTQHVDEFIIAPLEFDFPDPVVKPTQHYIGFMLAENRNDPTDPEYEKKSSAIFDLKASKKIKLIYCSFGTIDLKKKKIILSFLQKLISLAKVENFLLIISLKAQAEDIDKFNSPENTFIFNSVPQLEVLSHADLFITHGGINSIKESIHAEVPMLMYPLHDEYDPKGNSSRVVYHGLGLRGNAMTDSEKEIKEKINALVSNPLYKRSVQELKRKDTLYTSDKLLEKFNSIKLLS